MSYAERLKRALEEADRNIVLAADHIDASQYSLAATRYREAARLLVRAADEQQCIDMVEMAERRTRSGATRQEHGNG